MGFNCQEIGICQLVIVADRKAGVVIVDLNIIWLYAIKPFLLANIQPGLHDWSEQVETADIEPAFARPTLIIIAKYFRWKLLCVRTFIFPRSDRDVADNLYAAGMEFIYHRLIHIKVNIINLC